MSRSSRRRSCRSFHPTPPRLPVLASPPEDTAPYCLPLGGDRALLACDWPQLGPVLRLARNPAAVLGSLGPYPALQLAANHAFAWTDDAELMVDFTAWRTVTASAEAFGNGTASLFNVVAADSTNAHRVILPPDANHRAFAQILRRHAARPGPGNKPAQEHPPAPWQALRLSLKK